MRDGKIPDHEKLPKDCVYYKHFLQVERNSAVETAATKKIKEDRDTLQDIGDGFSLLYLKTFAEYREAIDLTKADVDVQNGGKPLVIDFTAKWCAPCKKIRSAYEAQIEKYPEFVFKKLDVDACPEGARAAEVFNMPTFKVYMNGEVFSSMELSTEKSLVKLLEKAKKAWHEKEAQ